MSEKLKNTLRTQQSNELWDSVNQAKRETATIERMYEIVNAARTLIYGLANDMPYTVNSNLKELCLKINDHCGDHFEYKPLDILGDVKLKVGTGEWAYVMMLRGYKIRKKEWISQYDGFHFIHISKDKKGNRGVFWANNTALGLRLMDQLIGHESMIDQWELYSDLDDKPPHCGTCECESE